MRNISQALGRWWRKFVVDEDPDARRERLHWELIHRIQRDMASREARRLGEIEN